MALTAPAQGAGPPSRTHPFNRSGRRLSILVVEDDDATRELFALQLRRGGHRATTAADGRRALRLLESGLEPDAVLLDAGLPSLSGVETLKRIRAGWPKPPVIIISGVDDVSVIADFVRRGAADYLVKPVREEQILASLSEATRADDLDAQDAAVRIGLRPPELWSGPAMRELKRTIERVAATDAPVLIQGETGVGKEVVARAVHAASRRFGSAFVKVLCSAIPIELLESELFGYEKGSFTGATTSKKGRFEIAHGGTILLDEIGDMPLAIQPKLLEVLQDGEFSRIGSNVPTRVDARVIVCTHLSIEDMVHAGTFRADLLYRLDVIKLRVPSLRERREQVLPLFEAYAAYFAARYARPVPPITPRLRRHLQLWSFPGNVRELENLALRFVILGSAERLRLEVMTSPEFCLADEFEQTAGQVPLGEVRRRVIDEIEAATIERVLIHFAWNRRAAARALGVSYSTLLQKVKQFGLVDVLSVGMDATGDAAVVA